MCYGSRRGWATQDMITIPKLEFMWSSSFNYEKRKTGGYRKNENC